MKKNTFYFILKAACTVVLSAVLLGFLVMYLWNWLIPSLFAGPSISFVEAIGLLVLSKILLSGFPKGKHKHCRHCGKGTRGHWKSKLRQKLEHLNPEEKEKFRQRLGKRCQNWDNDTTASS
jgi:hypothetical protein